MMDKMRTFLAAILLLVPSWLAPAADFHFFDPTKLTDIQGTVQRIGYEEIYEKKSQFLMLTILDADQRLFQVEVCPQWFFVTDIAVGMKIHIRGSLLEAVEGATYLIAQEVSLQGERTPMRDSKGFPLWSQRGAQVGRGNKRGPGGRGRR